MTGHEDAAKMWENMLPPELVYDHSSRSFLIDGVSVTPLDLLPLWGHKSTSTKTAEDIITEVPLVIDVSGNLSVLPRMYYWLLEGDHLQHYKETRTVMREFYGHLLGYELDDGLEGDQFGFEVFELRPGHIKLSVLGDCACSGPELDGFPFDQDYWAEGFATYGQHNVDDVNQELSLYAGLGHLAALVLES